MMKAKTLIISLMTLFACTTVRANIYHETTTKVNSFDYSGFTYTYLDKDSVLQTANLTDEATSTEQIVALLKEVYINPNIPGIHYGYDFNGMQSRKMDYNNYGHLINGDSGYEWQRNKNTFFPNPEQDGMTLMLVKVNDNWKKSMATKTKPEDYIEKCYTSVKVMTNFTRVNDSNNPGYIFSIDQVNANRFFFISKGKPRSSYTRPLYRLYEQISPVKGDNGHITEDFVDSLKVGKSYLCYHDCSEVATIGTDKDPHFFVISKNGENYNLNNLAIFIPDRRFEPQHDPEGAYSDTKIDTRVFKDYGNSNDDNHDNWMTEVMPKVLVYTADLKATAEPSDNVGYYNVNLEWSTSFNQENLNVDVPQHFYVYEVYGNNRIRLATIIDQPTTARTHTYQVQQTTDPQTLSYVITAHTINYDNDGNIRVDNLGNPVITISAESPVRTVLIPGHNPFFTQAQEYRSRYEAKSTTKQYNVYKNKMMIRPTTSEDFVSIKNNQEEYEVIRTDADGNMNTIAYVKFTSRDEGGYSYTVAYNSATQETSTVFDDEEPVISGVLTDFNNSTVEVIDRFTASTINNDHSDKYIYTFEQKHGDEYDNYSNSFVVPVLKTTNTVEGQEHTFSEVLADINHSAKATPSNYITFDAVYDPTLNLVEYDVYRADYQIKKLTKISKAEHYNNSGVFQLFSVSEDGMMNDYIGSTTVDNGHKNITVEDFNNKNYNQQSLYVPVITALYAGNQSKKNTYGCEFKTMYYPQLTAEKTKVVRTEPFSGDGCTLMGYRVDLRLRPQLSGSELKAYYYRVWRVINGETKLVKEALLNTEEDTNGVEGDEQWGTNYAPIKDTYAGYNWNNGKSSPIEISDMFIDYAIQQGQTKEIDYIARLYATTIEDAPLLEEPTAHLMSEDYSDEAKIFYIAEDTAPVDITYGTITAVGTINTESQITGVTYYNMMGVASNRPHQGINIVVTQYSDGSTRTEKVLK